MLRILKFSTNVGYDLLYCVIENQHAAAYHCLICPFFFLSKHIFCYKFLSFYESQSSNFVYTLRVAKYIVGQKTKLRLILPYFSFLPSLTPMQYIGKFMTDISQELLHVGFCNLVQVL